MNRLMNAGVVVCVAFVLGGCASSSGGGGGSARAERAPDADEKAVVHSYTPTEYAAAHADAPLAASSATLFVNGMGCPLCVTNVDKQLVRVTGVQTVKVDLGAGTVDVGLSGKTKPTAAALAKAVDDAGLTLVKISLKD